MATIGGNSSITDGLVFYYDTGNKIKSFKGEPTTNLSSKGGIEKNGTNEYLPYESIVGVFDTYGIGIYTFSFEMRTPVPGNINCYTADGTGRKYMFTGQTIQATTDWVHYSVTVDVVLNDAASTVNNLSFYGTYGTGRIPYVRNVQIEKKPYPTPFTPTSRSATESLLDLTGTTTLDVSNTYFESITGLPTLNGLHDIVSTTNFTAISNSSEVTYELWVKLDRHGGYPIWNNNCILIEVYESYYRCRMALDSTWRGTYTIFNYPLNQYHQIVFTWKSGQGALSYLNGEPNDTSGLDSTFLLFTNIGDSPLEIGMRSGASRLDGKVPIVKVYNKALTAAEVKRNFQAVRSRFNI